MKRLISGLMLTGTLFLTACGGTVGGQATQAQQATAPTTTQAPETTQPTTQAPEPSNGPTTREDILANLRELTDVFDNTPDSQMFDLFDSGCDALRAGNSIQDLVNGAVNEGFSIYDSTAVAFASVGASCPELIYLVDEYIDSIPD